MFTISISFMNDYFSQQHTNPVTMQDIKNGILNDPKGKGFYYQNLILLNYHNEPMQDHYPITETTVFKLIIKPMVCNHHDHSPPAPPRAPSSPRYDSSSSP